MKKGILCAIGVLVFLAGCGDKGNKGAGIPVEPKWKGAPYRIAFDTKTPKPNPSGIALPVINFTANPEALETRATLVIRFDTTGGKRPKSAQTDELQEQPAMDQMVMAPVDVRGPEGALPADYMEATDKELGRILGAYCLKGKVKITVALAKSSVSPHAGDAELTDKRLSDWLPLEIDFKNPHPKC